MRFDLKKAVPGAAALALLFCCAQARAAQKSGLPEFSVSSGTALLPAVVSTGAVVGRGGNFSMPLPDGRTLWLLNNVWAGEVKADGQTPVWGIIDGAAAIAASTDPYSQAGDFRYVADENNWPLPLLSGDLKEYTQVRKFWPRSGLCAGGRCYVFYSIMNNFGPDPYDYFRVGQGLASSENPAGPYAKARRDGRYSLWNDIEPAFGSALWADEDGWVYVYGRASVSPGEYGAELARVKPEHLLAREKYEYYTAEGSSAAWTADVSEASEVLGDMPEEFSVSYNDYLKAYLAVYYEAGSGRVAARQAAAPWGPWGEPSVLLACAREEYCYGAKEQPGFAAEGGKKIFLTLEKKNAPYLYGVEFK
ncbi:MAG: hypothetical protein A2X31_04950 [Elusimicrobia bacterium GWB2_63_22]|nr:MAG: hypothetical protein A2X31_04950 [Elusimicrobia bacterium GWB2_63_22]